MLELLDRARLRGCAAQGRPRQRRPWSPIGEARRPRLAERLQCQRLQLLQGGGAVDRQDHRPTPEYGEGWSVRPSMRHRRVSEPGDLGGVVVGLLVDELEVLLHRGAVGRGRVLDVHRHVHPLRRPGLVLREVGEVAARAAGLRHGLLERHAQDGLHLRPGEKVASLLVLRMSDRADCQGHAAKDSAQAGRKSHAGASVPAYTIKTRRGN